jgi:hypothetical protein
MAGQELGEKPRSGIDRAKADFQLFKFLYRYTSLGSKEMRRRVAQLDQKEYWHISEYLADTWELFEHDIPVTENDTSEGKELRPIFNEKIGFSQRKLTEGIH